MVRVVGRRHQIARAVEAVAGRAAAVVLVVEELQVVGNIDTQMTSQKNWIYKFLSQAEIESVAQVVELEEQKTSGEIVTVIVKNSSYVGHIPYVLTSLLLASFLFLGGFELLRYEFGLHFSSLFAILGPYSVLLVLTALFYVFSQRLKNSKCVQRLLIPRKDQREQVEKRAFLEYYLNHVAKTENKTGILIFISLMEQQTVVLADESISKKLKNEVWSEIVETIVLNIKNKKTAHGLIQAIRICGNILAQHFPAQAQNKNELSNSLIIKE